MGRREGLVGALTEGASTEAGLGQGAEASVRGGASGEEGSVTEEADRVGSEGRVDPDEREASSARVETSVAEEAGTAEASAAQAAPRTPWDSTETCVPIPESRPSCSA